MNKNRICSYCGTVWDIEDDGKCCPQCKSSDFYQDDSRDEDIFDNAVEESYEENFDEFEDEDELD